MRILMLNNEFPPLGGGTATVNWMLLRALQTDTTLHIDLVTATAGRVPLNENLGEHIEIHRVPVGDINPHHARHRELLAYTWKGLRLASRLARQQPYDAVLAWHTVPAGAIALWLRLRRGLPYALRIGGSDLPGHERRYALISHALLPLLQLIWRSATAIIVKCDAEETSLRRFFRQAPCRHIPNGVDTQTFHPAAAAPTTGPLRLIIVARLIAHKGHATLFRAMQRLRAEDGTLLTLDIVGTGDAETACRQDVAARGLTDQVTFHGYQPRTAVADCYRRAEVFVLPSEGEGMSISTLEAMACGLALLVTPTGGTELLLETGVNGLAFPPGDDAALAGRLRELAADRPRVQSMGRASRAKALHFSWDTAAQSYRNLFTAMAQPTPE